MAAAAEAAAAPVAGTLRGSQSPEPWAVDPEEAERRYLGPFDVPCVPAFHAMIHALAAAGDLRCFHRSHVRGSCPLAQRRIDLHRIGF